MRLPFSTQDTNVASCSGTYDANGHHYRESLKAARDLPVPLAFISVLEELTRKMPGQICTPENWALLLGKLKWPFPLVSLPLPSFNRHLLSALQGLVLCWTLRLQHVARPKPRTSQSGRQTGK